MSVKNRTLWIEIEQESVRESNDKCRGPVMSHKFTLNRK